jgi:hypothetical protein
MRYFYMGNPGLNALQLLLRPQYRGGITQNELFYQTGWKQGYAHT